MNPPTIIVLVIVAAIVFLAVRHLWKNRGKGCVGCANKDSCSCGGGCSGSCGSCGGGNHGTH